MSRSGFFLSVSGPAAILTLLIHPTIRQTADQWTPTTSTVAATSVVVMPSSGKGVVEVASIPNAAPRATPALPATGRTASDKEAPRLRKPLQEGCERAISSLAGPEARRMVPGRCMT